LISWKLQVIIEKQLPSTAYLSTARRDRLPVKSNRKRMKLRIPECGALALTVFENSSSASRKRELWASLALGLPRLAVGACNLELFFTTQLQS
jgi:hypothetical protein